MRRSIRVKELHTPCAGHRPGAADPKRSKAAYPPPRRANILNFVVRREKILNFSNPERESIQF